MLGLFAGSRGPLSAARLQSVGLATLVLWQGIVVAISAFLAQWQPAFAVANLAVDVCWILLWIPRRARELRSEASVEIAAARARVYSFLADPTNWPRYDADLVSVTVHPPGALAAGSEVTQVRRYERAVRGPAMLPDTVEARSVVIGVRVGESIATEGRDGAARSTLRFADQDSGTRVVTQLRVTVPLRVALLGGVIALHAERDKRRTKARENLARLKAILEQG
jgi:uncharacterized membrane protein